ncbi:hypothetical protein [Nocardia arthritidis]|uniref:Uncharacterized protein n=1 Tax=Nocardia arthritidis TaxID=228602 RepID=A0A6G9YP11_9NOCA|nr:hypothetical protein [Nocardia arthritidis]QIS15035.1 hypothetical protein F5544_36025 [Nocardia arthritidis]
MDEGVDLEIEAMGKVSRALSELDDDARGRVIRWVAERHNISLGPSPKKTGLASVSSGPDDEFDRNEIDEGIAAEASNWEHFAELYSASGASTHPAGMLVAAYWVQVLKGQDSFGSLELNKLLKDLGHGVTGTSKVMSTLIAKKPSLILQLKKSGKSQQARKTYRLTDAGKKTVEQMIA